MRRGLICWPRVCLPWRRKQFGQSVDETEFVAAVDVREGEELCIACASAPLRPCAPAPLRRVACYGPGMVCSAPLHPCASALCRLPWNHGLPEAVPVRFLKQRPSFDPGPLERLFSTTTKTTS